MKKEIGPWTIASKDEAPTIDERTEREFKTLTMPLTKSSYQESLMRMGKKAVPEHKWYVAVYKSEQCGPRFYVGSLSLPCDPKDLKFCMKFNGPNADYGEQFLNSIGFGGLNSIGFGGYETVRKDKKKQFVLGEKDEHGMYASVPLPIDELVDKVKKFFYPYVIHSFSNEKKE